MPLFSHQLTLLTIIANAFAQFNNFKGITLLTVKLYTPQHWQTKTFDKKSRENSFSLFTHCTEKRRRSKHIKKEAEIMEKDGNMKYQGYEECAFELDFFFAKTLISARK